MRETFIYRKLLLTVETVKNFKSTNEEKCTDEKSTVDILFQKFLKKCFMDIITPPLTNFILRHS